MRKAASGSVVSVASLTKLAAMGHENAREVLAEYRALERGGGLVRITWSAIHRYRVQSTPKS